MVEEPKALAIFWQRDYDALSIVVDAWGFWVYIDRSTRFAMAQPVPIGYFDAQRSRQHNTLGM